MRAIDLAVVGGGPAGLTTAIALARHDPKLRKRVVVIEKGTYPREKFCAGELGGRGVSLLESLDAVPDVPSATIRGMAYTSREGAIEVRADRAIGRVVRRLEFDHALAKIAAARGIEIIEGAKVERIALRDDRALVLTTK